MIHPQLLTFLSVAENGSFSKTAEAMFLSPTAVMKQIDALEGRLGVTLFSRTNHGLALTEAGKSVLDDAKYLVDYTKRAAEKARELDRRENQRSIRIGTSVMTPAKFILDIWADIQYLAPNLKIELIPFENTPENAREILRNLGKQIDVVAGIYDDHLMTERNFQVIHLEDKAIAFAVPLTSPLAAKKAIAPGDLKETGVMFIHRGWNCYIDRLRDACEDACVKVTDFPFFNLSAFNTAVKENLPIIAVDGWESIHPLLRIVPSEVPVTVPYGIMYSPEPSGQVRKFIRTVDEIISKNKGDKT